MQFLHLALPSSNRSTSFYRSTYGCPQPKEESMAILLKHKLGAGSLYECCYTKAGITTFSCSCSEQCSIINPGGVLETHVVDRISDLPDPILETILSYLPTKEAVSTSILSTRWKTLFPFINLNLDEVSIDFLYTLLNKISTDHGCRRVDTLTLKCHRVRGYDKEDDMNRIVSWICAMLQQLYVKHLDLDLILFESEPMQPFFRGISHSTSLQSLTLVDLCHLYMPDNFYLPCLKRLCLNSLSTKNQLPKFISSCPVLDDLSVVNCRVSSEDIYITSFILKKLEIKWDPGSDPKNFYLDAPNLQVFDCSTSPTPRTYHVPSFRSLIKTSISAWPSCTQLDGHTGKEYIDNDGGMYYYNFVAKLVSACSNTIHLQLPIETIRALDQSPVQLPIFEKLTCLSLTTRCSWEPLARLLHRAPNLEMLILEGFYGDCVECLVPTCLEKQLKRFQFEMNARSKNAIKVVEYFLENGKVLEQLKLVCVEKHVTGRAANGIPNQIATEFKVVDYILENGNVTSVLEQVKLVWDRLIALRSKCFCTVLP